MKEAKKEVKKEVKKATKFKVTKANGRSIYRDVLSEPEVKSYESKGCKVEEV